MIINLELEDAEMIENVGIVQLLTKVVWKSVNFKAWPLQYRIVQVTW